MRSATAGGRLADSLGETAAPAAAAAGAGAARVAEAAGAGTAGVTGAAAATATAAAAAGAAGAAVVAGTAAVAAGAAAAAAAADGGCSVPAVEPGLRLLGGTYVWLAAPYISSSDSCAAARGKAKKTSKPRRPRRGFANWERGDDAHLAVDHAAVFEDVRVGAARLKDFALNLHRTLQPRLVVPARLVQRRRVPNGRIDPAGGQAA